MKPAAKKDICLALGCCSCFRRGCEAFLGLIVGLSKDGQKFAESRGIRVRIEDFGFGPVRSRSSVRRNERGEGNLAAIYQATSTPGRCGVTPGFCGTRTRRSREHAMPEQQLSPEVWTSTTVKAPSCMLLGLVFRIQSLLLFFSHCCGRVRRARRTV